MIGGSIKILMTRVMRATRFAMSLLKNSKNAWLIAMRQYTGATKKDVNSMVSLWTHPETANITRGIR